MDSRTIQPLSSPVDHDYIESDPGTSRISNEYTPLLSRPRPRRITTWTWFFIVFILLILIFGVMIGTYLLVEQDRDWPVNIPFDVVSRNNWDSNFHKNHTALLTSPAKHLIISHTNTPTCDNYLECQKLLLNMKETYKEPPYNMTDLPFNFMIGMDGETYEGRGWDVISDLTLENKSVSIFLGLIGNFESMYPSSNQLNEMKAFIDESIRRKKLMSTYTIIGQPFSGNPIKLFESIKNWHHWNYIST